MFHGPQLPHGRQCLAARTWLGLLLTAGTSAIGALAVGTGLQVALAAPWWVGFDDGDQRIRFRRLNKHGCIGDVVDTYEMIYRPTGLFEIELDNMMEQPCYLEFKCDQDSIHGVYHMRNDRSSDLTTYSVWWVTDIWKRLSLGECVDTMRGSIRFDQPLPAPVIEAVGGCLDAEVATHIDWYDGTECDEIKAHGVFLEKRIYTDGCIDTVNKRYVRYGQRFKCEDGALVEHYYPDFDRCSIDTDPRYNRFEHIWTYQRWRRFMEGGCIRFEEANSIKVHNPAAYRRIVRAIERTSCGNPIASFNVYSDRQCEDRVLTQEIVDVDGTGCIKMTSYDKRMSLRFCQYNTSHINMLVFNAAGCQSSREGSSYLNKRDFSKLQAGTCMRVAAFPPRIGPFYQWSFYPGRGEDPFDSMGACVDFAADGAIS